MTTDLVQELLSTCGLNQSERTVLLHLLRQGPASASQIAKHISFKRPTVYAALDGLIMYGLVERQISAGVTFFKSIASAKIPILLERQAAREFDQVKNAARILGTKMTEFDNTNEHKFGTFRVSTLESQEAVYVELEEALLSGDFCGIFDPQKVLVIPSLKAAVKRFLERSAITAPHIRELAVAGPLAEWYRNSIQNPNHAIRFLPRDAKIASDMVLSHDAVFFYHYQPKQETAIKVRQLELHESLMTIFDLLWKQAE